MVDFDVLGEQKTLGVERPDKLPDGLDVSVVTGEKGRGVLNIFAGSTTPEGEAIVGVLHGDEVYFLRINVLRAQGGVDPLLMVASAAAPITIFALFLKHRSSIKKAERLQKPLLSLILLATIVAPMIAPVYAASPNLNLKVEDGDGNIISGASVILFDSDYHYLISSNTGSDGTARLRNIRSGLYMFEVYYQEPGLNGEFWGSGTATLGKESVDLVFKRAMPRVVSVNVETQPTEDNGRSIDVAVEVNNPSYSQREIAVNLLIDRDQSEPFESKTSETITIASGSTVTQRFRVKIDEPGVHYYSIYLQLTSSKKKIITDQTPWSNAAEIPGAISIRARDAAGDTQTFFALFDEHYNYLQNGKTDGTHSAEWDNLNPAKYIIEAYHDPKAPLNLIEFWGTVTAQPSQKTLVFEQTSPTITTVKVDTNHGKQTVTTNVKNNENYEKQVKVSLISDSDGQAPFNQYQESEPIRLAPGESKEIKFNIAEKTQTGTQYIVLQTLYNNKYLITDQQAQKGN